MNYHIQVTLSTSCDYYLIPEITIAYYSTINQKNPLPLW